MRKYYYLIASIPDVVLKGEERGMPLDYFLEFCQEELAPSDYKNLKMMYFFNDIRNAVNYKNIENEYFQPCFYSREDFMENLSEPERFLPFLETYFDLKKRGERLFPKKTEIDELICIFYEHLDFLECDRFVKRYYKECELVVKNISTAVIMRYRKEFNEEKLIPFGEQYERIMRFNTPDLGLSNEFKFIEGLIEALNRNDIMGFEEIVEQARWDILDELVGEEYFGAWHVYAIGVKLLSVERWKRLSEQKGKEKLNKLIESIKNSIVFPVEF